MHNAKAAKPRLGFIGLGRIGQDRMHALLDTNSAEVVALADPDAERISEVQAVVPQAHACSDMAQLLDHDLDGVVIATPNALHAEQAMAALQAGVAVFCQKPLAPTAAQTREVVACARQHDRLLGVDLSYRHLHGMQRIKQLADAGDLGDVYALSLAFHNAYGPDKPWFYRRESAGGGCVLDLGVHLIDLALWLFDYPAIEGVTGRCYAGGRLLAAEDMRHSQVDQLLQVDQRSQVEDYASLQLVLAGGITVDIACSWHLPLGCDADIRAAFYGTGGGAAIRNVDGSFHDFRSQRYAGCSAEVLYEPREEGGWGGRAAIAWARQLAVARGFDAEAEGAVSVAEAIDAVYATDNAAPALSHVLVTNAG